MRQRQADADLHLGKTLKSGTATLSAFNEQLLSTSTC